MLDETQCEDYMREVKLAAKASGQLENLEERLAYLATYACNMDDPEEGDPERTRCKLFKDFSPLSFVFHMEQRQANGEYKFWFNGGLIYHGPHDGGGDGGAPTYSVNLESTYGWSVHT